MTEGTRVDVRLGNIRRCNLVAQTVPRTVLAEITEY